MSAYRKLLATFQSSVLQEDGSPAFALITDKPGFGREAQMAIYRRNYRATLMKAVMADFPALEFALGQQKFRALAEDYVRATPSRYFNLDKYPYKFPAYVAQHCEDAFAAEVAALEGAIAEVYTMEEIPAVTREWLGSLTPETLATAQLLPRRASRLLAFHYPVNRWLGEFRAQENPARPEQEESFAAVWRHRHNVKRRDMEPLEFQLFMALSNGQAVGEALETLTLPESLPPREFLGKLQRWFTEWVDAGLIRDPS